MTNKFKGLLRILYVVFAFCAALLLGALKGLLVGPIAGLILILGNIGVILGLFPVHVYKAIYTIIKTKRFDAPLKVAILLGLPVLAALWLSLSITASVIVGLGYGFFTPWVSTFEAFRQENEAKKLLHCIVDGTWDTIRDSCTIVRDFADLCIHSYPMYLKGICDCENSDEVQTLKFLHIPAIIIVGLLGIVVEVPLYTAIVIVKSPYMLFKGWQRLTHDLFAREGPFLETACIPVAGLAILFWPIFVAGSIVLAIFTSVVVGLYGSVVVYQEKSFKRGLAYIIAQVAEFDEYTNDWLYLREGTLLPKPRYRKKSVQSSESTVGANRVRGEKSDSVAPEGPSLIIPNIGHSRSVRETIQDVKMVQVWGHMMQTCESRARELIDANVITSNDLCEWLKAKQSHDSPIVGVGLPSYSFLQTLVRSNQVGTNGVILFDDVIVTHENRPQDRLFDWFFQPVLVLKEQIKMLKLDDGELRYLEKVVLFGSNLQRLEAWENGCVVPKDPLRAAQIQGISRRLIGMVRSMSMLPTYRRKYRRMIKVLVSYNIEREGSIKFDSVRSVSSADIV
ncbi:hypothetical protein KSS87_005763 [Heliosperma pusillum]|nr:hypothetical protein KSS87_005763 [Heliosperma pusillum]